MWDTAKDAISLEDDASDPQVIFSCIEGQALWPGEGNINMDPLFTAPGDYHLQEGSTCIDAGTFTVGLETDIDGNARLCGAGADMGAYEYGDCPVTPIAAFLRGEVNADGKIDLADAIFMLTFLFAEGQAPGCMDAADANDDGKLNLADGIAILDYLYGDADSLLAPFGECGVDPTLDALDCGGFAPCDGP